MKERDPSKSIDDIFASVSRLGRTAGATEAADGRPSAQGDAESLTTSLASTIARAAKTSATGYRAVVTFADAAASAPDGPPAGAGTGDEGDDDAGSPRSREDDRLADGAQNARVKAEQEGPEPSRAAEEPHRDAAPRAVRAQGRALAEERARLAATTDEGRAGEPAPAQVHERARAEPPARFDELTPEERWAAEQAAAQVALLARHRAEAEERAQLAEEERRAAEQAAPLARERALAKERARLAMAAEEDRRAAVLAESEAAKAAELRERAEAEERARQAAVAEQEHQAAEQAATLAAAQAAAEARERAEAEEQGRLAAVAEEERRAAEQAAALAAAEARERAEAEERARLAAAAEEERRTAEQAAASAAAKARERAEAEEQARLAAAAEEERRAEEAATSAAAQAAAAKARERAEAEERARLAAVAEEERRAAEQAAANAAAEARELARAEEHSRLAAAAERERQAAEQAAAEARERAEAEDRARLATVAEEEERQAAAREAAAQRAQERASDASPPAAPPMEVAASHTAATQSAVQTPGARRSRHRAVSVMAIAAALAVVAGAVLFMNRGSGEVGAASGGAFTDTASAGSGQMPSPPTTGSSTMSRNSTGGPVRSLAASAVAPPPSEAVRMVAEPSDSTAQWVARQLAGGPSSASSTNLELLPHDSWLASVQALGVQPRVAVLRYDVLQAAREAPRSARVPPLEVIAPIGAEPLFFVVRRDSPLRFIHELEGRAINVGPPDGARALTARDAYHRLFDDWPSSSAATALDETAALDRLATDRSLDAVAVLGASPLSTLARRAPLAAHGLKLLALDDNGAADQRLLATFLSIPVSDPALSGRQRMTTPGIVSFLVTARGAPNDHARHDDVVRAAAGSLCANWTAIGQSRAGLAISPELQADVGWPYAAAAQQTLARCGDRSNTAAANPVAPQVLSR